MPCKDISEQLWLQLDPHEHLRSYSLNKNTCGADIGSRSLLQDALGGLHVDAIGQLNSDDLRERFGDWEPDREFLVLKHLFALQDAIASYLGRAEFDQSQHFTLQSLSSDAGGIEVWGIVNIDLLNGRIRACGHCGSCKAA